MPLLPLNLLPGIAVQVPVGVLGLSVKTLLIIASICVIGLAVAFYALGGGASLRSGARLAWKHRTSVRSMGTQTSVCSRHGHRPSTIDTEATWPNNLTRV